MICKLSCKRDENASMYKCENSNIYSESIVSLPQGWVQGIKRMFFLCMVYFSLNTKHRYARIIYYSVTLEMWLHINPAPCSSLPPPLYLTPLFTHLENQFFLLVVRIPIHSCPWFAINCSPFAVSPTLTHTTD
jgi:hypothetical protein